MASQKTNEKHPISIRVDKQLYDDCFTIAKLKDSDFSKEIRKFLKRFREQNKQLLSE